MKESISADRSGASAQPERARAATIARAASFGAPARQAGASPAQALELQRAVGNRAATKVLSRWAAHPDPKEKGKLLSDGMLSEYNRFNLPLKT